jgi:uncharacterized protein YbaP (TraB family)
MFVALKRMPYCFAWVLVWLWLGVSAAVAGERGLLWKLEHNGAPAGYLFGTIHTDDARVTDFSPQLRQAMQQAQSFMMEMLPPTDLSVIFMPGSLRELLSPEEVEQLLKLAEQHALSDETALRIKPWLLATMFSLPRPQSPFAQDILLLSLAREQGLPLYGLEQTAEHFGVLDNLNMPQQLTLLRAVLAQPQDQKEQAFERVVQAYLSKELEQILKVDEQMTADLISQELWAEMKVRLLDQRNARMVQRITAQARKGPVFVAVGAAHLPGKEGLLALLRQAGYTVHALE